MSGRERTSFELAAGNHTTAVPRNLSARLIYFLDSLEVAAELRRKLVLVTEDHRTHPKDRPSTVFGYIINEPLKKSAYEFFKSSGGKFSDKFRMLGVMNSQTAEFETQDDYLIHVITKGDTPLHTENETLFGNYAAYKIETLEEAQYMTPYFDSKESIVMVLNEFIMPLKNLAPLIRGNTAIVRKATDDVVFNQSAVMRTVLAFPDYAPKFPS